MLNLTLLVVAIIYYMKFNLILIDLAGHFSNGNGGGDRVAANQSISRNYLRFRRIGP